MQTIVRCGKVRFFGGFLTRFSVVRRRGVPLGTRTALFFGRFVGLPVATAGTAGFRSDEQYPAPGYRHRDSGTLYAVGQCGSSWSSSVPAGSSDAHGLGFSDSWIYPQYRNFRAYGFQVRCLLE